ncbi:MAG: LysR family transcriptional regulator [Bacilli bacterium]|nr:LysR family transcriptional regulator [Bacilli bacterium]
MKILQLRYFVATVDLDSVSRASEFYHVSQPAVTTAIKNLEEEFSLKLFTRRNNKLTLTEHGKRFYEEALIVLNTVDKMEERVLLMSKSLKKISIGITSMIGTFLFPRLITLYKKSHPDIELAITDSISLRAFSQVQDEKLDLALVTLSPDYSKENVNFVDLIDEEIVFVVGKSHKFANKSSIDIADLDNEKVILFTQGSYQNQRFNKEFEDAEVHPQIFLYSSNLTLIQECLRNNEVGAFIYRDVATSLSQDLVAIPFSKKISAKIGLVYNKSSYCREDVKKFIMFAIKQASYYKQEKDAGK